MLILLKCLVQGHALHVSELGLLSHGLRQVNTLFDQPAVRGYIQIPSPELRDFALLLADDNRRPCLPHPFNLTATVDFLLLISHRTQPSHQFGDTFIPIFDDQVVHPHAGNLVDAHHHRLASFPRCRVMPDEVSRNLVQPLVCRYDVVISFEFSLQPLLDVDILGFQFFELLCDSLVQIADGHAELISTGVVVDRHGGLVLDCPLEVVCRNIIAENPPRYLISLEQRRTCESDVTGVRQSIPHIQGQCSILRPVCFIGNDDDIIPLRVALVRAYALVEFLNQREDVRFVLGKQSAKMVAAARAAWISVIVHHAAACEGLINLRVQVFSVGQD